jgi:GNAT superfamily N-acetyltransferase
MPRIDDPAAIRALLESDRRWAVYLLGDLDPKHFPHCHWHSAAGEPPVLLLLYQAFSPAVLCTLGSPDRLAPLLAEIDPALRFYLHIRPEVVPLLEPRYRLTELKSMWRMVLDPARFLAGDLSGTVRLSEADVDALERLYADGHAVGEGPGFYYPAMVTDGVFYGVYEGPDLVSVAGTHLVVPQEGIAAVGNIYTRRDRRGRGLAGRTTAAVVAELLRRGVPTIALNVVQTNAPAQRVYERLGFQVYCPFVEGLATPAADRERTQEVVS